MFAYDADIKHDMIISFGWLVEHDATINPRRMGLLFQHGPERDKWWVQGLKKHVRSEDIIVLWSELITDEVPLISTPTPPPSVPPPSEHAPCIQDVDVLDVEDMCRNLFFWGMSPDHEPLSPGETSQSYQEQLKDESTFDWCDDLDRMEVALHFIEDDVDEKDIGFIKGFVSSRDPVGNPSIGSRRQKILDDYKHTVFCGKTDGNPPPQTWTSR